MIKNYWFRNSEFNQVTKITTTQLRFGCPMWTHAKWKKMLFQHKTRSDLQQYGQLFNSVEGNTSFYRLPEEKTVLDWQASVSPEFKFTFKFPRQISHEGSLLAEPALLQLTLQRFSLFEQKLGVLMLQLPAAFGPSRLEELALFLRTLPRDFNYAVEVRNPYFFAKGKDEQQFNRLLAENKVNRVIMDTRGLFSCEPTDDPLILDVQKKKPKVPTNVIATAGHPIVRFVGHPHIQQNAKFMLPWIHKINQWMSEGLQPYLFFHMPDNAEAPWLAEVFIKQYRVIYQDVPLPELSLPAPTSAQLSIFD